VAAEVELAVKRDSLLEALPGGEGVLRFDGLDKQLVMESEDGEIRLGLANRPRRRKPVSTRIAFERLRLAVQPQDERVVVGLTDGRPLTVHSETARAVLSPLAPPPPMPRKAQPASATKEAAAGKATARKAVDADRRRQEELREAAQQRREEEQRKAEERRQAEQARAAARATAKARQALDRAATQLDAAAGALDGSSLGDLKPVVEELRDRVEQARRSIEEDG
jgi:type IV secretory pathway VirB10-like protein